MKINKKLHYDGSAANHSTGYSFLSVSEISTANKVIGAKNHIKIKQALALMVLVHSYFVLNGMNSDS